MNVKDSIEIARSVPGRSIVHAIALIVLVPLAAACDVVPEPSPTESGAVPPSRPASPAIEAHFEPGDMFTSVGDMPPSIVARWQDGEAGAERLDALAEALSLSSYPGGDPIPARVERRAEGADPRAARLLLRPEAPLEDQWYLLRLDPVPEGVAIVGDAMTAPDGATGVRFRPGAEVVTRRITACGGADGDIVLTATLSERVEIRESKAIRVLQGGAPLACVWAGPETPSEEKGHAVTVGEIRVRCAGAAEGAPLEITLAGEGRTHRLRGAVRPVTAGAAQDRPADAEGCEVLRP